MARTRPESWAPDGLGYLLLVALVLLAGVGVAVLGRVWLGWWG